jgi:prepilin-type N-terminal cleavage/methylation domain-containing protein
MAPRRRAGHTLIELLIVVAVLAVLGGAAALWYTRGQKGFSGEKRVAAPKERAQGVACWNNLHQIALALQQAAITGERPPTDIRDSLQHGVTESMLRCPETRQPYRFDPAQALLICATPGHQTVKVEMLSGQ